MKIQYYLGFGVIISIFYMLYLIIFFEYREYKIQSHIESITQLNYSIKEKIDATKKILQYKNSRAYKNQVLKDQLSFKNKGEIVLYVTTAATYNTFIHDTPQKIISSSQYTQNPILHSMSIFQKWKYFIFQKSIQ